MNFFRDDTARYYRTVWLNPRDTIRSIVAEDSSLHVTLLACLAGVAQVLDRAASRNLGDKIPGVLIFMTALIVGPLSGLIGLWVYSHLLKWTGKWLGGNAPRDHLKAALAWSSVPVVFSLVLWVPKLLFFGPENFTEETPRLDEHPLLWVPFLLFAVVELVLLIWGLVIFYKMVAEVQGFRSAWRGLGNSLLAGLALMIPILLVVLAVVFLIKSFS